MCDIDLYERFTAPWRITTQFISRRKCTAGDTQWREMMFFESRITGGRQRRRPPELSRHDDAAAIALVAAAIVANNASGKSTHTRARAHSIHMSDV